MIEKEPITVILSEKGWIRAMKGHMDDLSKLEFKQGDGLKRAVKAQTTDKLLLLASNGKVFTLPGDQLPGGRGHGEPVRLMVDLEENHDFVEIFVHEPGRKLLVAATSGHGFIVPEDEVVAMTRKGKQVMNVDEPAEACACVAAEGDMVAAIGENRKMLVFPPTRCPRWRAARAYGCSATRTGACPTCACSRRRTGLAWLDPAGRTFTLPYVELREWVGQRAQAGRLAPRGFPKSNKFGPAF